MDRALVAGAVVPLALLGACAGPLNHESSIGEPGDPQRGVELGSINPEAQRESTQGGLYDGSPWRHDGSGSLKGIDRDNWTEQAFLVPTDGTSHQPTYSVHPDYSNGLARERGLYPDQTTCLDLRSDTSHRDQALEAVAAPFYSGLDIVMWLPRAAMTPPWATVQSPGTAYERSPRLGETWVTQTWMTGPLPGTRDEDLPPTPAAPAPGMQPEPSPATPIPAPPTTTPSPTPPAKP
jgi:hypothetical protein